MTRRALELTLARIREALLQMQLVIVESPAKAKTIEKYLGPGFKVLASYGHVRDLPPKDGSVRPDEGFAMDWDLYGDKAKQVKAIADAAKQADGLILATDPDREGEAISWHVRELLAKRKALPKDVSRVTFNAITKQAVTDAMKAPRDLDQDLIDAYLALRAGEDETFIETFRRLGLAPFKAALYPEVKTHAA